MDIDTLYAAAIAGDADAIAKLEMKADRLTEDGETILHIESEAGNTVRVQFILKQFASKNLLIKLTEHNHTALHLAAYDGHTKVAEVLIDEARRLLSSSSSSSSSANAAISPFQAFLRQGDREMDTALHAAVMNGHLAIVKLLVEADPSDTHVRNIDDGKTPLYIAAEEGYIDIIKVICTTCIAPSLDGPGDSTALHAAIENINEGNEEDREVIRMIIDAAKRSRSSPFEALFNRTDEYERTVLELAVNEDYMNAVELILLEDPSYQDGRGSKKHGLMSLIYEAIDMEYSEDIVKLLSETYEAGINPLHRGVLDLILNIKKRDKASIIRLLGVNKHIVSFSDDKGWTPLHYAALHEFDSILNAIISAQEDVEFQFVYEDMVSTPFHVAAKNGYISTLIRLMQLWPLSSPVYTSKDKNGQNIMHMAAVNNNKEMILSILKYIPERYKDQILNAQNSDGNTPLHILISNGCFIPEIIKHKGLDIMARNKKRWTPRDMLYLTDDIIGDQVQIKIALDNVIDTTLQMDILGSLVLPSKREAKDVTFDRYEKMFMDENHALEKLDLESYKRTHSAANRFADAIDGDAIARAALEMEAEELSEDGETILHVESKKGYTEAVRYIVREFADKNFLVKLDRLKQTALHLAAHHGHTQVVEVLIDAARRYLVSSSANVDTRDPVSPFQAFLRQPAGPTRNTALHLAVLNANVAIVELLVEADPSDRHIQNNEGKSPIYIAAEYGYKNIIKVICTTCTTLSLEGPRGSTTALHALIKNIQQATEEWRDVIRMIINAARRWSSADKASHISFEELFNRIDESGSTILQLAVEKNNVDAVKLILLEDPAYQHGRGTKKNGLMRLIYKAIVTEYSKDIVKVLSEAYEVGINPQHKGVIALILAIKRSDTESVLRLLGKGKHLVTFAEDEGWTTLHYAAYHECIPILDAVIDAQKAAGHPFLYKDLVSTPLQVAAENGHTYTVIRLMQLWPISSSAYTAVNKNGRNILHLAAAQNKTKMIQGILEYCPGKYKDKILKEQDANGDTPLHIVISNGCFVPELIKYKGLNTMPKNKKNWTPRDMLYFQDEIVADQVQIKIALDHVQNQSGKLWHKSMKKEMDYFESIVLPSKRETKNLKFKDKTKSWMDEKHAERQKEMKNNLVRYKKRTNTQIIVTALITTVTFTVGFTMPGGLHQSGEVDEGLVLLSRKTAFNAFMVSDALALLLSTSSLFFYFLESMNEDPQQVSKLSAASTVLNIVSIMAMMLTFIAGTYVVLSHSPTLAFTVCVIGFLFFLLLIVILIKIIYDRQVKQNED